MANKGNNFLMAEVPDPDQHQINYFWAPGQSLRHTEIHAEVAGKRQTDTTEPP